MTIGQIVVLTQRGNWEIRRDALITVRQWDGPLGCTCHSQRPIVLSLVDSGDGLRGPLLRGRAGVWLCRESCIVNGEAGTALSSLPRPFALETETCAPCPSLPPGCREWCGQQRWWLHLFWSLSALIGRSQGVCMRHFDGYPERLHGPLMNPDSFWVRLGKGVGLVLFTWLFQVSQIWLPMEGSGPISLLVSRFQVKKMVP